MPYMGRLRRLGDLARDELNESHPDLSFQAQSSWRWWKSSKLSSARRSRSPGGARERGSVELDGLEEWSWGGGTTTNGYGDIYVGVRQAPDASHIASAPSGEADAFARLVAQA